MKKKLLFSTLLLYIFIVSAQTPGVPMFDTSGNEYIEYIPGNLPIIISAPHGGVKQSGSTVGGTFYPDNDSDLPDRGCGTNERDDNTDILVREIQAEIFSLTGRYAHIIISNLHRSKMDPNREPNEATCGDSDALFYWNAFHGFIDQASTAVENNWGKGLYIDLHGQSHGIQRIEVGYNITATQLDAGNINAILGASIANLVATNLGSLDQESLVRGATSLGQLFQEAPGVFYNANNDPDCGVTSGYRATPSNTDYGGGNNCDDQTPHGNPYFDGDFYNNRRHGSGSGADDGSSGTIGGSGSVDGIMTEVNRRVRDLGTYNGNFYDARPQTLVPFAQEYAVVVLDFIDTHYNDYTEFNYAVNSYDVSDPDPTPTISGIPGGSFTSTSGLTIDVNTGTIDVSTSIAGNYIVTYSIGTAGYFETTRNIEITDFPLGTEDLEASGFQMFPNPAESAVTLKSDVAIDQVKIFSMTGQKVRTYEVYSRDIQLDITGLRPGSYLITFIAKNKMIGSRIMIRN